MRQEDFRQFRQSKIPLFSRTKLRSVLPGEWESVFAGEGIEFADIKPFEPGDDLRALDLRALVQSGEEEIIQRVVERQMRVFVWLDLSGSMQAFDEMVFSGKPTIMDIALGLLLFSAANAYCPVGLYGFNRDTKRFFPARAGERHCWEILDWVIEQQHKGLSVGADIQDAISFMGQAASPQSLVLFLSDFQDQAFVADGTALLRPVVKKFDFVPVIIMDPLQTRASLTRAVNVKVADCEGVGSGEIYMTPQMLREVQGASARYLLELERTFRQLGIERVVLDSSSVEDCYQALSGFFESRRRVRA